MLLQDLLDSWKATQCGDILRQSDLIHEGSFKLCHLDGLICLWAPRTIPNLMGHATRKAFQTLASLRLARAVLGKISRCSYDHHCISDAAKSSHMPRPSGSSFALRRCARLAHRYLQAVVNPALVSTQYAKSCAAHLNLRTELLMAGSGWSFCKPVLQLRNSCHQDSIRQLLA